MAKFKKNNTQKPNLDTYTGLNTGFTSAIIGQKRYRILRLFFFKERTFFRLMVAFVILAAIFYPYPRIAMWVGFCFAAYSAIANDSIQTIGTFIASNDDQPWWKLWLYIGGIFVITVFISWSLYDGDVSYERLSSKGFSEAPTEFHFLQLAAPLILLVITRVKMPVSTTFLLLSAFSGSAEGIISVTQKSLMGYVISFIMATIVWLVLGKFVQRITSGKPNPIWRVAQWIISGGLWSVWVMQDAANIAVFLDRSLSIWGFVFFAGFIFFGLGLLFYLRGDKIQQIVREKSQVTDVRAASIIDLVYAAILYYFKVLSTVPISTTWVFLGLLGGRELAMQFSKHASTGRTAGQTISLVLRDVLFAFIGLAISIILAVLVNPNIQEELGDYFGY